MCCLSISISVTQNLHISYTHKRAYPIHYEISWFCLYYWYEGIYKNIVFKTYDIKCYLFQKKSMNKHVVGKYWYEFLRLFKTKYAKCNFHSTVLMFMWWCICVLQGQIYVLPVLIYLSVYDKPYHSVFKSDIWQNIFRIMLHSHLMLMDWGPHQTWMDLSMDHLWYVLSYEFK